MKKAYLLLYIIFLFLLLVKDLPFLQLIIKVKPLGLPEDRHEKH